MGLGVSHNDTATEPLRDQAKTIAYGGAAVAGAGLLWAFGQHFGPGAVAAAAAGVAIGAWMGSQ